ncbi:MAG: Hpt domain-containing protein, partial [Chloroflexota bacterium]|nr:Hpt domain-containing protein [Chloroflexota bacterium]
MADNFDQSAILGSFFDEVDAYIPEIEAHLDQLQQTPDDETAIEEAYRRAHTINGSAAMMSFAGLSSIAQSMEVILDDALERRASLDQSTIALLRRSCGRLARVAQLVRAGADDSAVAAEDQQDHAAYRGPGGEAPQPVAGAPAPAQGVGMDGPSPSLPDWLASLGPTSVPSTPSPAGGAFSHAPSQPSGPIGPFAQSSAGAPMAAAWGRSQASMPINAQNAPAPRDWATSQATQPPAQRPPAPAGAAPALDELRADEEDVRRQVGTLRDTVAALRDAAQAMDNERIELQSFLDGSHDALERLEEWVGQQMGLDLRRSPETVRSYLPLSVIWVTTTRLKKLIALLNASGRELTLSREQIEETLGQFRSSLDTLSRMTTVFTGAAPDGGFSATVAQVTWAPPAPSASLPSVESLTPAQRAEMERSVREDLRRSLEDDVRQEIAADVRREEEQRIRQELEVQIRRQMMFSALGPGMGESSVGISGAGVEVRSSARSARQVQVTKEQSPETLSVFREEAQELLQTITSGIADLERSPDDVNALRSVRRAMHTLKGAAGMMSFVVVQSLAHASEDLLDLLSEKGRALSSSEVALVFDTAETLDQLISGAISGQRQQREVAQALIDRYGAITGAPVVNLLAGDVDEETAESVAIDIGADAEDTGASASTEDLSVRLKLSKLDELVTRFGDLLVNRSVFEERIGRIYQLAGDMKAATERLREVGSKLESQFETFMLPSGQAGAPGQNVTPPPGFRFPWRGQQRATSLPNRQGGNTADHLRDFDELELDRYNEFHRLSRILSEAVTDVLGLDHEMETLIREVQVSFAREARLSTEVQDRLLKARLVPVSSLAPRLYRAARASALKEGKEVEFFLEGGDTEVDRKVIEEVEGPLLHLVRNAVNHGIERPDAREAQGKPRAGRITVAASYEGNQVVIEVADDGAGIDPRRVRETAIAKGWIDGYANLNDRDALNLIFQPGVSTAETLTEESGRGVGLDVVRDAAARLKGSVDVDSTVGAGAVFTLKFPISLQIARAVLVKAGPQTYAIPMAVVDQIGRLDYYERVSSPKPAVMVRNDRYELARLATYLRAQAAPLEDRSSLLIVHVGGRKLALVVDGIVNQQEIVAKPMGAHLADVRGVAGATVLGNGQVIVILDLAELLARPMPDQIELPTPGQRAADPMAVSRPAPSNPLAWPQAQPATPFPFAAPEPRPAPLSAPAPAPAMPAMPAAQAMDGEWPFDTVTNAPDEFPTEALPGQPQPVAPPVYQPPVPAPTAAPTIAPSGPSTASALGGSRDFVVAQRSPNVTGRNFAPAANGKPSYLLVVDDSPSVRRVVGGMLKANGWETKTARDGVEALDVIANERPAAVLLDIEMPRM